MSEKSRHLGIALVATSAVCWSTAGLFARAANLDTASLVFWSSISACLGLLLFCAFRLRADLPREIAGIGLPGLSYIAVTAVCSMSYVIALQYTSVANVMTIYAMLPFAATAIAFVWLKERVSRRFIIAGLMAMSGVAITAGAAASADDVIGLLAGLLMTVTFATQLVITKRYPQMDILLVNALAAGVAAAAALPFVDLSAPSALPLAASVLYGLIPYALGNALALAGGRLIKSGEAGFIAMLDVVLGPVWVWAFFNEQPTMQAIVGGIMVLGAVGWYLSNDARASVNPQTQIP